MTREQHLLIQLLSVALGKDNIQLPIDEIEWSVIFQLSEEQELSAIALDGYQKIHNILGSQAIGKSELLNWLGNSFYIESQYDKQYQSSKELSDFFYSHNHITYVLKGISIARCYPNPKHRFSCDFDCMLIDIKNKAISSEDGNKLVEGIGGKVDRSYYKNSSFVYKGLHVENHCFCCSIKRGKKTKELETILEGLLLNNPPTFIGDTKIALPPLLFQALFLIEHASGHFLYEKMSLKNICDWAMFRKHYQNDLDWPHFYELCERYGLLRFVGTMNHLADLVLGSCNYNELKDLDKKVLEDTLKQAKLPSNPMLQRINKASDVLHSNWKFKYFSKDSMLKELSSSFFAFLFDKNPQLV